MTNKKNTKTIVKKTDVQEASARQKEGELSLNLFLSYLEVVTVTQPEKFNPWLPSNRSRNDKSLGLRVPVEEILEGFNTVSTFRDEALAESNAKRAHMLVYLASLHRDNLEIAKALKACIQCKWLQVGLVCLDEYWVRDQSDTLEVLSHYYNRVASTSYLGGTEFSHMRKGEYYKRVITLVAREQSQSFFETFLSFMRHGIGCFQVTYLEALVSYKEEPYFLTSLTAFIKDACDTVIDCIFKIYQASPPDGILPILLEVVRRDDLRLIAEAMTIAAKLSPEVVYPFYEAEAIARPFEQSTGMKEALNRYTHEVKANLAMKLLEERPYREDAWALLTENLTRETVDLAIQLAMQLLESTMDEKVAIPAMNFLSICRNIDAHKAIFKQVESRNIKICIGAVNAINTKDGLVNFDRVSWELLNILKKEKDEEFCRAIVSKLQELTHMISHVEIHIKDRHHLTQDVQNKKYIAEILGAKASVHEGQHTWVLLDMLKLNSQGAKLEIIQALANKYSRCVAYPLIELYDKAFLASPERILILKNFSSKKWVCGYPMVVDFLLKRVHEYIQEVSNQRHSEFDLGVYTNIVRALGNVKAIPWLVEESVVNSIIHTLIEGFDSQVYQEFRSACFETLLTYSGQEIDKFFLKNACWGNVTKLNLEAGKFVINIHKAAGIKILINYIATGDHGSKRIAFVQALAPVMNNNIAKQLSKMSLERDVLVAVMYSVKDLQTKFVVENILLRGLISEYDKARQVAREVVSTFSPQLVATVLLSYVEKHGPHPNIVELLTESEPLRATYFSLMTKPKRKSKAKTTQ